MAVENLPKGWSRAALALAHMWRVPFAQRREWLKSPALTTASPRSAWTCPISRTKRDIEDVPHRIWDALFRLICGFSNMGGSTISFA
jgi:hypothetical protein